MRSVGSSTVEEVPRTAAAPPKRRWLPVTALEFVGCDSCRMTLAEFEAYPEDGKRIEFFDSETGVAWTMREPMGFAHEDPGAALPALVARIGMVRGAPIKCRGSTDLRLVDTESRQMRVMQPDQMVFLRPDRLVRVRSQYLSVGEHDHPDVVLEVDHTTDIRRSKLKLYEEWGFPELWVEVPDTYSSSRPARLKPGLRIYVLEGGRYVESLESRAFPGWRAQEIHRALNENVVSAETAAVLTRVGRALAGREGTGPDDDPMLRAQRAEARARGVVEGRLRMVRSLLTRRRISVPTDLPAGLTPVERDALAARSEDDLVEAALRATSVSDFRNRLR